MSDTNQLSDIAGRPRGCARRRDVASSLRKNRQAQRQPLAMHWKTDGWKIASAIVSLVTEHSFGRACSEIFTS
jgi:hypothetical protein